ncbi:hypothetical protein B0H10DRAFT_1976945 [Mycena sp. CBHHK59/15]|nr:hypothetical protein B0H10DRAFT_1976945 [Mycena sp. CBHHK59/15]
MSHIRPSLLPRERRRGSTPRPTGYTAEYLRRRTLTAVSNSRRPAPRGTTRILTSANERSSLISRQAWSPTGLSGKPHL